MEEKLSKDLKIIIWEESKDVEVYEKKLNFWHSFVTFEKKSAKLELREIHFTGQDFVDFAKRC